MGRIVARGVLACALLGLVAGCASTDGAMSGQDSGQGQAAAPTAAAPRGPVPAGAARLTLTRVSGIQYAGAAATVKVNGKEVASLWSGSSETVNIAPGANAVTVEAWSYPGTWTVNLNAKAGASYALEISPRAASLGPSMLLGPVGGAIDASANANAGAFEMRQVR